MTIIEKALTRLETIEKKEKKKKPSVDDLQQGPSLAFAPRPTLVRPPASDFIVDRVKRRRNRRMWIAPVISIVIVVFVVLFSWRTNLFNVRQWVKNSDMYLFVVTMIESTEPQTLPKIAVVMEPEYTPEIAPESSDDSITPIAPVEKPEIIVSKPEITHKKAKAVSQIKEYSWINKGWMALDDRRRKDALDLWGAGLRTLARKKMVLVAGVYENQGDALKKLRLIGKGNSAFVVRGKGSSSGKNAYYLLSTPYPDDLQSVRKLIASALDIRSIKGNYANKVLAKMRSGLKTAKTSTGAGKKKQTAVAKTVAGKSKRTRQVVVAKSVKRVATERGQKSTLSYGQRIGFVKELLNDSLYSEAVDNLQPLFDTPPGVWEPYLLMGTAYLGLGDLDMADSYFKKGLAVDGNRPRLWLQRAVVAQQKGDHDAALKILHKVEKLAPRMPEIKLNIGYSSDVLGKKDDAARAYQSFLVLTDGRGDYVSLRLQVVQRLLELGYQPTE